MTPDDEINQVADRAAQRYEKQHAEVNRRAPPPGPGDYNPEIEQIWAVIRRLQQGGGGGAGDIEHPFQIVQIDTENIWVRFGQVQSITPTDIETNIDVNGTNGTWTIYLECTLNTDGEVTAVSVEAATTGLPADDSDSAFITIGTVVVTAAAITAVNQALTHSLRFRACDRDPADTATTPGTYHFWGV